MTYSEINKKRTVPWWTVFVAPMVGVPLVVAALAVVAPAQQVVDDGHTVDFPVESVEIDSVVNSIDGTALTLEHLLAKS
jgi:hypothetical protein